MSVSALLAPLVAFLVCLAISGAVAVVVFLDGMPDKAAEQAFRDAYRQCEAKVGRDPHGERCLGAAQEAWASYADN